MNVFYAQANLLASGASESEIYIWDLNNTEKPMTPGSKSQVCPKTEEANDKNRST